MARVCAFCGGTPITAEHGWPKWLENVLPGRRIRQSSIPDDFIPRQRGMRRSVAGGEVRAVCESCNTGWMSNIETDARSVVGPMIEGCGTNLDQQNQATVATWIIKTCLVHALSGPAKGRQTIAPAYKSSLRVDLRLINITS